MLAKTTVPVIEIWELWVEQIGSTVGFHHDQVGNAAAEHLLQQGRRNLVFLKPVAVNWIHCDRLYLLFSRMYVIVLLRTIKRDML
jgi:DNA-binding LacI/PurR family transcriptional regulator